MIRNAVRVTREHRELFSALVVAWVGIALIGVALVHTADPTPETAFAGGLSMGGIAGACLVLVVVWYMRGMANADSATDPDDL